jgi:hypothetical protein
MIKLRGGGGGDRMFILIDLKFSVLCERIVSLEQRGAILMCTVLLIMFKNFKYIPLFYIHHRFIKTMYVFVRSDYFISVYIF